VEDRGPHTPNVDDIWRGTDGRPAYCYGDAAGVFAPNRRDRQKPEVLAPGVLVDTPPVGSDSGTSLAAPFVAGIVGLVIQAKPSVEGSPSQAKAIVMASGLPGGYLEPNRKNRKAWEGAGLVSARWARLIAVGADGTVDGDDYESGTGHTTARSFSCGNSQFTFNVPANRRVRVVVAWPATPGSKARRSVLNSDVNLTVFKGSQTVGHSSSANSSTEMVDFNATSGSTTYTAKVQIVDSIYDDLDNCAGRGRQKVAWAWVAIER